MPPSWRVRRGRGVVTLKSAEAVQLFLRRIGAGPSLLELEARQVARTLRGELNRVINAESANLARTVAAAGRQVDAIDALAADGRLARESGDRARGRGGPPRDARGDPRRAGGSAGDPPLGRAARAGADRAAARWRMIRRCDRSSWRATGRCTRRRPRRASWRATIARPDAGRRRHARPVPAVRVPGGGPRCPRSAGRRGAGRSERRGRRPERASRAAGAYTGAISAPMLAGLATWVIVGHSRAAPRRRRDGRADRPEAAARPARPGCG